MEKERKSRTVITVNVYNAVKIMINGGAKIKEIATYLNIGEATVSRIKASQSYEEYKQIQRAAYWGVQKDKAEKEAQEKLEEEQRKQEELKKQQEEEAKKRQEAARPQPFVQTVTVQATHYMMEELREMNKTLTLISNKLTFIVEQLQ